jgi:hypothetical protein
VAADVDQRCVGRHGLKLLERGAEDGLVRMQKSCPAVELEALCYIREPADPVWVDRAIWQLLKEVDVQAKLLEPRTQLIRTQASPALPALLASAPATTTLVMPRSAPRAAAAAPIGGEVLLGQFPRRAAVPLVAVEDLLRTTRRLVEGAECHETLARGE